MEKKLLEAYHSPAITVVNLESRGVICTSGTAVDDPEDYEYGGTL